jgi:tetraacyldisaccharide 4'-kinase
MIRAPGLWTHDGGLARVLAPLSHAVTAVTARHVTQAGWRAPVPVICCGNATVGGAGKTTLALDLAHRLTARGIAVHILLRGYRGAARGPRRVVSGDQAAATGDEALLLAEAAPTWTGADRAASAAAAVAAGAQVLLMDDGLQNPSLEKTMSLLVVDGATGFGNGRVLPAGPLREPAAAAASRCRAAVLIGSDVSGAVAQLPPNLPVLSADLVQGDEIASLKGRRVLAFTGIAIPSKFFDALEKADIELVCREAFADHYTFTPKDLARLDANARALNAILVTTPKDTVRLSAGLAAGLDIHVISVRLVWKAEAAIEALLDELVSGGTLKPSPRGNRSMA